MNLDQDFFQESKWRPKKKDQKKDQKKKVKTKKRKKKSAPEMEHFSPRIQVQTVLRCTLESNYWKDTDEDHTQIVGGIQ